MKRNLVFKISLSCFVVLAFVLGMYIYLRNNVIRHPLNSKENKVEITVEEGQNLKDIMVTLKDRDILKNYYVTNYYIKKTNVDLNIKQGVYSFSKDIPLEKIIRYLNKGIKDDEPVKVVIPEGYNIENIGAALEKKDIISKDEFIKSCNEYKAPQFVKKDSKRKYALEGYLFPDTYMFFKGQGGDEIVKSMLDRFDSVITDIEKKIGKDINNDELDKIIIMASVVEKEVVKKEERGKAASVFYNRIDKGMKLQSCATVLYALGVHKDKLYYNDLKVDSPYNTYIVKGLPQGPISCPGKECILSAINPEKTNYLYFVSKNDGTHFFTDDQNKFEEVKKATQGY